MCKKPRFWKTTAKLSLNNYFDIIITCYHWHGYFSQFYSWNSKKCSNNRKNYSVLILILWSDERIYSGFLKWWIHLIPVNFVLLCFCACRLSEIIGILWYKKKCKSTRTKCRPTAALDETGRFTSFSTGRVQF